MAEPQVKQMPPEDTGHHDPMDENDLHDHLHAQYPSLGESMHKPTQGHATNGAHDTLPSSEEQEQQGPLGSAE